MSSSVQSDSAVVESGPVEYEEHDEEDYDGDEDVHVTAAQLMGQEYGQGEATKKYVHRMEIIR